MNLIFIIPWMIFSVVLLIFTLKRPHPYRFPRFIAFESILSLIFLNANNWFVEPFSFIHIISWILLTGSLIMAILGFYTLKSKGEPEGDFEDTTKLITSGIYRYIRHPLYASLLFFGFGAFLKNPSILGGLLIGILIVGVFLTARSEESHNLERFGEAYLEYSRHTSWFIPYIF
jgi:protein-S-isoprenylcysteine O-methyltransferase Ste14